jgi:hypothetical protein
MLLPLSLPKGPYYIKLTMLQYIAVLGGYSDMQRSGFAAEVPTLFKQDP